MITSKQNALIKEIRSLSDKKNRDELGQYIVEGIKPVLEALSLGEKVCVIVCTEKGEKSLPNNVERTLVSDEVFKSISEEKTPQGVLGVFYKPQNRLEKASGSVLLLDGVSDPSNVGAIIRTAAASGYQTIYLTENSADAYSQKAVRASMSGIFRVRVIRADIEDILSVIDQKIVVADMGGKNVFENKIEGDFCLVIGNEGRGVSQRLKDLAKEIVSIPMLNGVESLNAAVSAGILMYNLKA